MGIQGLLQFLKEASEPVHVGQYKGQTVAVDTYCWLHKGAFACAEKLAKGEPTNQYVTYCMKFVHMLLSHGVTPILVFDGCTLPSKKDVERTRREKRQVNLQKGKQLLREGKLSEARDCFSRSINITSEMAHRVIKAARSEGVDCIVAPYEADSQLAYLNKNGFAQAVVTEDSDLLAFGCKKVILKMDQYGNGLEIDQARFGKCRHLGDVFTEEKFRYMCILSGCDYLPSIHGVGLAKASKVLKIANNPDIMQVIKKIGQYLKSNITVPDGYTEGFLRANNTFLYQLVFDPTRRKLLPLNPYEEGIDPEDLSYAGPNMGDSTAYQIALGNVDVNTMKRMDDYDPDVPQLMKQKSHSWNKIFKSGSIWQGNVTPCPPIKSEETPRAEEKASRRGLIVPSNKHPVKRPLQNEVSESDILSQYSFSQSKRSKKESDDHSSDVKSSAASNVLQPLDDPRNTDFQLKPRNKFATLLQRRNEPSGLVPVTGTRSRFFCSRSDLASVSSVKTVDTSTLLAGSPPEVTGSPPEVAGKAEVRQELCKTELSPSPSSDDCAASPGVTSPLRNPRNCFSWSGSLGRGGVQPQVACPSLQRFQRTKRSVDSGTDDGRREQPADSTEEQTFCPVPRTRNLSVLEAEDSDSEDTSLQSSPEFTMTDSPAHHTTYPERKPAPKTKVSGLLKSKSYDSRSGTKLKPMVRAKASGLSSRVPAKASRNQENTTGLQATISDLWRNFSFKKH